MNRLTSFILTVFGTLFVVLGIVGIFLPLLPTTPFLLLGAACYVRGSQSLYDRLISHKVLGRYILNYREGKGIPLGTKVFALSMLWLTIGFSVLFVLDVLMVKLILILIASAVTVHLLRMKTLRKVDVMSAGSASDAADKGRVFLAEPSIAYKEQFEEFVKAYKDSGETHYFEMYQEALQDFEGYVTKLGNYAKGIDIPDDSTLTHTYWLTNDQGILLGIIRIRPFSDNDFVRNYAGNIDYDISPLHRQQGWGRMILKLGLEKARSLGMHKVLITCSSDNVGSIRIIEGNGGIFEEEVFCESKNTILRRYWIML